MSLLEALRERRKVMLIIEHQDPRLLTNNVKAYRELYLTRLNLFISNLINSISHDSNKKEATERSACMGRVWDQQASGNKARPMGIIAKFESKVIAGYELYRRRFEAKVLGLLAFVVFPFVVIIAVRERFIEFNKAVKEVTKIIPNQSA